MFLHPLSIVFWSPVKGYNFQLSERPIGKSVMVGVFGDHVWTLGSKSFFMYLILKVEKTRSPNIFYISAVSLTTLAGR